MGIVAVIVVLFTTFKFSRFMPPIVQTVSDVKLVPFMEIACPGGPACGVTPFMIGSTLILDGTRNETLDKRLNLKVSTSYTARVTSQIPSVPLEGNVKDH